MTFNITKPALVPARGTQLIQPVEKLNMAMQMLGRSAGDPLQSAVRLGELVDAGVLSLNENNQIVAGSGVGWTEDTKIFRADFGTNFPQVRFTPRKQNSGMGINVFPSGTSTVGLFHAGDTSDPTTHRYVQLGIAAAAPFLNFGAFGPAAAPGPLQIQYNSGVIGSISQQGRLTMLDNFFAQRSSYPSYHWYAPDNPVDAKRANFFMDIVGTMYLNFTNDADTVSQTSFMFARNGQSVFPSVFSVRDSNSSGYIQVAPGDASHPGYIDLRTADNARRGLIGYADGTSLLLTAENGWSWKVVTGFSEFVEVVSNFRVTGPTAIVHAFDRTSSRQWGMYGQGDILRFYNGAGADVMTITPGGAVTAVSFTPTSDRRMKLLRGEVEPREDLADQFVLFDYNFVNGGDYRRGLVAQDVRSYAPEYVPDLPNGYLGLDGVGLLTEAVAGLARRIQRLENAT